MVEQHRQILKFIVKRTITAALLTQVPCRIDLAQLGQATRNARWSCLWVVLGPTIVACLILSVKMRMIFQKQGCQTDNTLSGCQQLIACICRRCSCHDGGSVFWFV